MKKCSRRVLSVHVQLHQTLIVALRRHDVVENKFCVVQLGRLRRWERSVVLVNLGDDDPLRNGRSSVLGTTPAAARQWCPVAKSDPHE